MDVDKLFHANPPSLSPNRPANVQRPYANQNTDRINDDMSETFEGEFKVFRGSRHDEFDWSLTKVNNFLDENFQCFNYIHVIFQKVLDGNNQNTVVSPFLVKLLLSIL